MDRPKMGRAPSIARGDAAGSSSSSLVHRSSDSGAISLAQQTILTEEAYVDALDQIIMRDFFPQLARQRAEADYLDALESGDEFKVRRAVRRIVREEEKAGVIPSTPRSGQGLPSTTMRAPRWSRETVQTPSRTPYDTPVRHQSIQLEETPLKGPGGWAETPLGRATDSDEDRPLSRGGDEHPLVDVNLSLDAFQRRYTSMDNASFSLILARANERRKERFGWAFDAERRANERRLELATANEKDAVQGRGLVVSAPEGDVLRLRDSERLAIKSGSESTPGAADSSLSHSNQARSSSSDTTSPLQGQHLPPSFHARNAFFFGPDAEISTDARRTSSLPEGEKGRPEEALLSANRIPLTKPGINRHNTRFQDKEEPASEPYTPTSSRIDAAIRGTSAESWRSTPSPSLRLPSMTPRVSGYSFVSPLPTPRPGDLGADRMRQLMTWGSIVSTPRALAGDDAGSTMAHGSAADDHDDISHASRGFKIPPTPRRDVLAHHLGSKSAIKTSVAPQHTHTPMTAPSPSFSSFRPSPGRKRKADAHGMLSPAARTLLQRTSGSMKNSLGHSLLRGVRRQPFTEEADMRRLRGRRWTPTPHLSSDH